MRALLHVHGFGISLPVSMYSCVYVCIFALARVRALLHVQADDVPVVSEPLLHTNTHRMLLYDRMAPERMKTNSAKTATHIYL